MKPLILEDAFSLSPSLEFIRVNEAAAASSFQLRPEKHFIWESPFVVLTDERKERFWRRNTRSLKVMMRGNLEFAIKSFLEDFQSKVHKCRKICGLGCVNHMCDMTRVTLT